MSRATVGDFVEWIRENVDLSETATNRIVQDMWDDFQIMWSEDH